MRRGAVWWALLPAPMGRRPVVFVSRNEAYAIRKRAIAAPVTTRIRGIDAEIVLGPEDGLPRASVANLDTLMTVPFSALQEYITTLSPERLGQADAALRYALGLAD